MRVAGQLVEAEMAPLTAEQLNAFVDATLPARFRERWVHDSQVDYSFDRMAQGKGRFRVNAFLQRNQPAAVLRLVKVKPPQFAELNLDEKTMLNYHNRTIEPILDAIVESMERTFVGRAGVKKRQRIRYFRDPFKLVPVSDLAEIADKFTRNEILTSNEIRGFMGIPPAQDPKADELVNSNMPQPQSADAIPLKEVDGMINEVFDGLSNDLNQIAGGQSGQ
jgi:hypothetical protein